MIQFFAPNILEEGILPEGESVHCCRVLRKNVGDEIVVTDGKGHRFHCRIIDPHPKHTQLEIISSEFIPKDRNYSLTVAVAPTKNSDRMEWFVEKAVEIGVDRIVLLKCDRSERKVQKIDRIEKVAAAAMKQSLGVWMPEIADITSFKTFINGIGKGSDCFFGYCNDELPRKEFAKEYKGGGNVVIMIGPEGDFTTEEVSLAIQRGFVPVTFGNSRLRTETAALYAVAAVSVINNI